MRNTAWEEPCWEEKSQAREIHFWSNSMLDESHVEGILCGGNTLYVQGESCSEESCMRGTLYGRNPVWEEPCMGEIQC